MQEKDFSFLFYSAGKTLLKVFPEGKTPSGDRTASARWVVAKGNAFFIQEGIFTRAVVKLEEGLYYEVFFCISENK